MRGWMVLCVVGISACGRAPDDEPVGPGDPVVARCDFDDLEQRSFDTTGPFGVGRYQLAEDIAIPTLDGPFPLADSWSGCDVHLFIPESDESSIGFGVTHFERDHEDLLRRTPENAHLFFFASGSDAKAVVRDLRRTFEDVLAGFKPDRAAAWEGRLHFIDQPIDHVGGWISEQWALTGYGFGIDRAQRIRDIGSLADPERFDGAIGWFGPNMSFAANEAVYYNFEARRQEALDAENATVVGLYDEEVTGGGVVDVDLPGPEVMATFDHLDLDLTARCDGSREFGSCPAWDYLAGLSVCGIPDAEPDPRADQACQPYVAGSSEVAEVLGHCVGGGEETDTPCREAVDCEADGGAGLRPAPIDTDDSGLGIDSSGGDTASPDTDPPSTTWSCSGYVPASAGTAEVSAETASCTCTQPDGSSFDGQQSCRGDGTGFGGCGCPCSEVGRWVTTYHREGRWISDATHGLAWLRTGGRKRFAYSGGNSYRTTLDLRLSTRDVGAGQPYEAVPLFTGGGFDPSYNDKYRPLMVDIPADATRVELVAIISGHGFGNDALNCAEFCDHQHHFTVGSQTWIRDHPMVGDDLGCMAQVDEGAVPNQFGTWFYGRGGWCPGKEVEPFVVDVTAAVTPGGAATVSYEAWVGGHPGGEPQGGGFYARIDMNSWLVIWR